MASRKAWIRPREAANALPSVGRAREGESWCGPRRGASRRSVTAKTTSMTMPVSRAGLLAGKVAAYVLVCLTQFALMLAAGVYLLPLLGTSGLEMGRALSTVAPIALCAALAATGYGMMVGTLANSYEQGTMFGMLIRR